MEYLHVPAVFVTDVWGCQLRSDSFGPISWWHLQPYSITSTHTQANCKCEHHHVECTTDCPWEE